MAWFTQRVGSEGAVPWLWLQQGPQALAQHPSPWRMTVFLSLELGHREEDSVGSLTVSSFSQLGQVNDSLDPLSCSGGVRWLSSFSVVFRVCWVQRKPLLGVLWIRATLPTFILTNLIDKFLHKCCPSIWVSDIHPFKWAMQWLSETVA